MPGSLLGTPRICRLSRRSEKKSISVPTSMRWPWWRTCWCAANCLSQRKASELFEYHLSGSPAPPSSVRKIPPDVSDAILAGLARNPADRPASAVAFARRFHNAVDAEFLALRRSKAFLLQHLAAYALLVLPIYSIILAIDGPADCIQPETGAGCRGANRVGPAGSGDSFHFCRQHASRSRSLNGGGRTSPRQEILIVPSGLEAA